MDLLGKISFFFCCCCCNFRSHFLYFPLLLTWCCHAGVVGNFDTRSAFVALAVVISLVASKFGEDVDLPFVGSKKDCKAALRQIAPCFPKETFFSTGGWSENGRTKIPWPGVGSS